jgi:hypothetical protein
MARHVPHAPALPCPAPDAWREALECFGVAPTTAAAFAAEPHEDRLWDFASAVLDSPFGLATDWRGDHIDALRYLAESLERIGVTLEADYEDDRMLIFVQDTSEEGADPGTRYGRAFANEWEDFHGVIFALERCLPQRVGIYCLVPLDDCDTYGHAVLPTEQWQRLRRLLGPTFDELFHKHPPSRPFQPAAGQQGAPTWEEFVQRTVRDRRRWLASRFTRKSLRDESREEIMDTLHRRKDSPHWPKTWKILKTGPEEQQEFLDSLDTPQRLAGILGPLSNLAHVLGAEGAVRVLTGTARRKDAGGWPLLHSALLHRYWYARIAFWQFTCLNKGRNACSSSLNDRETSYLLAEALALGEFDLADWCCRRMQEHPAAFGLPANGLKSFLLRLNALRNGAPLKGKRPGSLGVYRDVLAAWNDPDALADALARACDHHCRRARGAPSAEGMEFYWFPHSVFAPEVLAVLRVRDVLGLTTPALEHPLLANPLARPPAAIVPAVDPVLDRVMAVVEEELPPS